MSHSASPTSAGTSSTPFTSGRFPIVPVTIATVIALSVVALLDAVVAGLTGRNPLADTELQAPAILAVSAIHTLCYLAIVAVLLTVARPVFAGRRWRSVLRWLLVTAYGAMGVVMLVSAVLEWQPAGVAQEVVNGAFAVMLVAPGALGVALLVRRERTAAAWLLSASIPAFGLAFFLAAVAPQWAHPAYAETCANLGLALLGTRAAVGAAQKSAARASGAGR